MIGKIVAYADQKEQIEKGFGWRYKVRILGDNSDTDQIEDQYLSYATVLLLTTAGTGAAYKLRSVRLSQGYGIWCSRWRNSSIKVYYWCFSENVLS